LDFGDSFLLFWERLFLNKLPPERGIEFSNFKAVVIRTSKNKNLIV